jgi:hypothetical protein
MKRLDRSLFVTNIYEMLANEREIRYKIYPDVVTMGLAVRSLYLVTQYILLSDAEAQAIAYHDGRYIEDNKIIAHKEEPLTLLVHWADYWIAHIYEEGRPI